MADALGRFRRKAFERPGVKAAYDALADEFAFLDEVLAGGPDEIFTKQRVYPNGSHDAIRVFGYCTGNRFICLAIVEVAGGIKYPIGRQENDLVHPIFV